MPERFQLKMQNGGPFVQSHKAVCGKEGKVQRIISLGREWRSVSSFSHFNIYERT
jgi:hypothetical protein